MYKHTQTLSIDAISAFFSPLMGETVTVSPWAFCPKKEVGGSYKDRSLCPFTVRVSNIGRLPLNEIQDAALECDDEEEIGLSSKVVVHTHEGPVFKYVEMLDMAPGLDLSKYKAAPGERILATDSSFHVYGPDLQDSLDLSRRLIVADPIDTQWAGFSMSRGFAVLRISGVHKRTPALIPTKTEPQQESANESDGSSYGTQKLRTYKRTYGA